MKTIKLFAVFAISSVVFGSTFGMYKEESFLPEKQPVDSLYPAPSAPAENEMYPNVMSAEPIGYMQEGWSVSSEAGTQTEGLSLFKRSKNYLLDLCVYNPKETAQQTARNVKNYMLQRDCVIGGVVYGSMASLLTYAILTVGAKKLALRTALATTLGGTALATYKIYKSKQ